jgi:hypothetical protein
VGMKEAETMLAQWRDLERQLESADGDSREDLRARIAELRDRYQVLVDDALLEEVDEIDAVGGRAERAPGAA